MSIIICDWISFNRARFCFVFYISLNLSHRNRRAGLSLTLNNHTHKNTTAFLFRSPISLHVPRGLEHSRHNEKQWVVPARTLTHILHRLRSLTRPWLSTLIVCELQKETNMAERLSSSELITPPTRSNTAQQLPPRCLQVPQEIRASFALKGIALDFWRRFVVIVYNNSLKN